MNILSSVNEIYIHQFKCMVYSLVESQKDPIDLYFVNLTLTDFQLSNLKKYAESLDITFHEIIPSKDLIDKVWAARYEQLEILNRTFSLEAFVRLFAHILLPQEVTRILWLDVDCIIQRDISKMYNYNFFDNVGFATIDGYELDPNQKEYVRNSIKAPLGLTDEDIMFNSGVLLLNLKKIRELEEFKMENLLDLLKTKPELHFDQDVLNYLCKGKIIISRDLEFNYPPNWSTYDELKDTIYKKSILHYYGIYKPWLETSNTPVIGIIPWRRAEKMVRILDKILEEKHI